MEWLEFEHEIRDLVEEFGYTGISTPPSGDFGVDVLAKKDHQSVVIQCKLYGKGSIGGDHIMKLVGSKSYFSATHAICITTSKFTKQAKEIAENAGVLLVDRIMLMELCRQKNLTIPSLTFLIDKSGNKFDLKNSIIRIGRFSDNDIVLDNPHVSKYHAVSMRYGLHLSIQDNQSTNGTFVNDEKILKNIKLNYGDRLKIDGFNFVVAMCTPSGTFW